MSKEWAGRRASTARAKMAHTLPRPCYRCGHMIPDADTAKALGISWDVEHTVPLAEGGTDSLDTLAVSHSSCNRSAGGKLAASRKAQTKIVRQIEAERSHKFWNLAFQKIIFEFSRGLLRVLDASPLFFLSGGGIHE